uniref:Hexosyltransferase n=1 Tax=Plectus sambesii TaxID=2011161 RepID=A0A914VG61_9BILA
MTRKHLFLLKSSIFTFFPLILLVLLLFNFPNNLRISAEQFAINASQSIQPILQSQPSRTVPTTTTKTSQVYRATFKDVSYTYSFLLTPVDDVCEKGPDYEVVVFIISAAEEIAQREAIRSSWAEKAADTRALVLFVVGYTPKLVANLNAEQEQNNDMIVSTIQEHYRNLTLKAHIERIILAALLAAVYKWSGLL